MPHAPTHLTRLLKAFKSTRSTSPTAARSTSRSTGSGVRPKSGAQHWPAQSSFRTLLLYQSLPCFTPASHFRIVGADDERSVLEAIYGNEFESLSANEWRQIHGQRVAGY